MSKRDGSTTIALVCVECGVESEGGARGWRALLTDEEIEPAEVVVYCGECAGREFDG